MLHGASVKTLSKQSRDREEGPQAANILAGHSQLFGQGTYPL